MSKLKFTKMVASGNDFVVFDSRGSTPIDDLSRYAKTLCDRHYGVGADGFLVVEDVADADARMRIVNPDGSEVNMCGNGIRCAARYACGEDVPRDITIDTAAGVHRCHVSDVQVMVALPAPHGLKVNKELTVNNEKIAIHMVNTGVPHAVIFVDDLDAYPVQEMGAAVRYHKHFEPEGTNVNFAKIMTPKKICVRTYERGVEAETLACGTGSMASAIIAGIVGGLGNTHHVDVEVIPTGGDVLTISYDRNENKISNLCFTGGVKTVFQGEILL